MSATCKETENKTDFDFNFDFTLFETTLDHVGQDFKNGWIIPK